MFSHASPMARAAARSADSDPFHAFFRSMMGTTELLIRRRWMVADRTRVRDSMALTSQRDTRDEQARANASWLVCT